MSTLDLIQHYQALSSVAVEARKMSDRALKELVAAERAAERAGCALDDEAQHTLVCAVADAWVRETETNGVDGVSWRFKEVLDSLEEGTRSSPLRKAKP